MTTAPAAASRAAATSAAIARGRHPVPARGGRGGEDRGARPVLPAGMAQVDAPELVGHGQQVFGGAVAHQIPRGREVPAVMVEVDEPRPGGGERER